MDADKKKRKKCTFFFLLNVLLEASAITAVIYCTLFSNCVLGNEVSAPVFIFLLFIFSAFIPDLLYLALSRKLHTLGTDPLGVMFNFIAGGLCILIGVGLMLVLLVFCGYYAQFILVIAGAFSVCSGVFHLMNALMCNQRLPKSERYFKHRHRRKGAKKASAPKKKVREVEESQLASTKSGQKDAKKVDKKAVKKDDGKLESSDVKKHDKRSDKKRQETATYKEIPKSLRILSVLLYLTGGAIELTGFLLLFFYIFSLCVLGRENSTRIWLSMNCLAPPITADLVFAIGGFKIAAHFYASIAVVYNIVMATLCILSAIFAFASITGCGNPAQLLTVIAGLMGLSAGGLHIFLTIIGLKNLEGGGKLFKNRQSK
ncbi:PREDICTED: uncharacterized protein LOC108372529 [Rhagoletis zephyria]|uniref:uncharacterized protein LOC108372529 n=1 Tax=Rhagoletis zephyria TaxID=28612 RepID=UPI0008112F38|nr:PREDICTED: uncharacterized protein LOC108372529 [Rhagoletis zephyria]